MSTREAQEWSAKDNYTMHKREYVDACVKFAEAFLEHAHKGLPPMEHPEIVLAEAALRHAKVIKDDAWAVLTRVIAK